jgi:hypothetical protein
VTKKRPRHRPNCGVSSPEPRPNYHLNRSMAIGPLAQILTYTRKSQRTLEQRRDHRQCPLRTSRPETSHRFLRQTNNTASKARLMGIHHGATEATLFFCFSPFLFLCGSMVNKSRAGSAGLRPDPFGCTWNAVMITYRIVPDIRKGSKGFLRPVGAIVSYCWRSSAGRASDL